MAGTAETAALRVTMDGTGISDGLKGWKKDLGLVEDATGKLFDTTGKWVDGLTEAQVKMGFQRDSLGQLRNANFELVEGLSKYEQMLGFIVREYGNVYDAQGNLIRQGAEQIAMNQKVTASQNQIAKSVRQAAVPMMHLATQIAVLGGANSKTAAQTTAMVSTFMSTISAASTMVKGIQGITAATQGATAAQVIYNAVSGNWVAIAVGIIAAGGVALTFSQVGEEAENAAGGVDKLSKEMERLKEIQKEIKRFQWTPEEHFNPKTEENAIQKELRLIERRKQLTEDTNKIHIELAKNLQRQKELTDLMMQDRSEGNSLIYQDALKELQQIEERKKSLNETIKRNNREIDKIAQETEQSKIQDLFKKYESSLLTSFQKERKEWEQEIKSFEEILESIDETEEKGKEARRDIGIVQQLIAESHQKEYESSDDYIRLQKEFEDELKRRNDVIAMARKFEQDNMSVTERRQKQISEQLFQLEKFIEDETINEREIARMEKMKAELLNERNNVLSYSIKSEIKNQKQKEQDDRQKMDYLKSLTGLGTDDNLRYKKMLDDLESQSLGKWKKYFDKTGDDAADFGKKMQTAGEELLLASGTFKSEAEKIKALGNLKDEIKKEAIAKAKSLTSGSGMPSAATYGSVEAYKVIAEAKDPGVQAIKEFQDKMVSTVEKVGNDIIQSQSKIASTR